MLRTMLKCFCQIKCAKNTLQMPGHLSANAISQRWYSPNMRMSPAILTPCPRCPRSLSPTYILIYGSPLVTWQGCGRVRQAFCPHMPVPPTVECLEGHCRSLSLWLPCSRASGCLLQTKAELSGKASERVRVKELCFHKKPGKEAISEGAQVAQ